MPRNMGVVSKLDGNLTDANHHFSQIFPRFLCMMAEAPSALGGFGASQPMAPGQWRDAPEGLGTAEEAEGGRWL